MKKISLLICCSLFFYSAFATNYYCDPVKGSMNNKGTYASPWRTLDSVFITNKKLLPGDTIFLRTGYHGFPIVQGNMETKGYVTIMPQKGQLPTVKRIEVKSAQRWNIVGLKISPEVTGMYEKGDFVSLKSTSSFISLSKCTISSTDSCINSWTSAQLTARFGLGIRVDGQDCTLSDNTIKQVLFGISVSKSAVRTKVSYNTIYGFMNDGIRGLSDDSRYEYNTVAGSYAIDDNHDDAFQSWSTDENGKVGLGKVSNVILRGNLFISQVDPDQPFKQNVSGMQGIGNFDGFFENWIVENNVILTDMWHGISFYGAINCKITNNVVLKSPFNAQPFTPWIAIYDHKKLGPSKGNIISNNLTSTIKERKGVITFDHNIDVLPKNYEEYFVNWKAFDVKLNPKIKKQQAGIENMKARLVDLKKMINCH